MLCPSPRPSFHPLYTPNRDHTRIFKGYKGGPGSDTQVLCKPRPVICSSLWLLGVSRCFQALVWQVLRTVGTVLRIIGYHLEARWCGVDFAKLTQAPRRQLFLEVALICGPSLVRAG